MSIRKLSTLGHLSPSEILTLIPELERDDIGKYKLWGEVLCHPAARSILLSKVMYLEFKDRKGSLLLKGERSEYCLANYHLLGAPLCLDTTIGQQIGHIIG